MSKAITGVVMRSTGSWYTVQTEHNGQIECNLKGKFRIKGLRTTNPIAVGDIVDLKIQDETQTGVIEKIHDRKNYIIRKATKLSSSTHIIAANVDQVVVIASIVKPRTSTGFIDRVLTTAEAYHIPAIIVFNKSDLYQEKHFELLEYFEHSYKNAGYQVIVTSVPDHKNIDVFKEMLNNKTSLIAGHSGVGKSALINSIDPHLDLKVGQISDYHDKGMHTTTFAEMFSLRFGGFIIDTPGIKEFGLVAFDKAELGQRFPEFRSRMQKCKFNNCLHIDEPGCAIVEDLEKGLISPFRYENYLNMLSNI